jgi:hypothetical protein
MAARRVVLDVRLDWGAVLPGHRGMVTACAALVLRRRGGVPAVQPAPVPRRGSVQARARRGPSGGHLRAERPRGRAVGGAVGASAHALSHWIDADLGGSSTASALLTVLAAALAAGLVLAETRRMQPRHESPTDDAGRLTRLCAAHSDPLATPRMSRLKTWASRRDAVR